jgi:hypothetical protein
LKIFRLLTIAGDPSEPLAVRQMFAAQARAALERAAPDRPQPGEKGAGMKLLNQAYAANRKP